LILIFALALTLALLIATKHFEWARLWTFENFTGTPAAGFNKTSSIAWAFALGFLLPAYTITGFDASAHTSEETLNAARNVPKGIIRSVWVSGLFGWIMICAVLLALPNVRQGVEQGASVVPWAIRSVLSGWLAWTLLIGIVACQYLCGLAALTSCSRMTFAFARDGGLPFSNWLRAVNPTSKSPSVAVWMSAVASAAFTILVPYATIAAICTILLYMSYVLPVAAGFFAIGRTWTRMGPWHLGVWYRPLAALAALGCMFLIIVGMQPPNQQAEWIVGGVVVLLLIIWFGLERKRFKGPPQVKPGG
jgi:amino acid transporter